MSYDYNQVTCAECSTEHQLSARAQEGKTTICPKCDSMYFERPNIPSITNYIGKDLAGSDLNNQSIMDAYVKGWYAAISAHGIG